jgi:DNA modification methylase
MNRVFFGDCRDSLRQLAGEGLKAQTCVTSPPYFGLRDYGHPGQLGLEPTPDEYVKNMVDVFRCVRDVLADDGTLWLNIGDSYCNTDKWGGGGNTGKQTVADDGSVPSWAVRKKRELIGIPWLLAFALRADGWYLRQDIIWHKPNPMPESVRDRCTKAHEYVFLMSKAERYYFDSQAMKEPAAHPEGPGNKRHKYTEAHEAGDERHRTKAGLTKVGAREFRNRRSVWTVATEPYSGAHFAVFPPALIEPCILAGSRSGDIVLDPFFGSGTTGQVAQQLGRQWIGCEINPAFDPLQRARTAQASLLV